MNINIFNTFKKKNLKILAVKLILKANIKNKNQFVFSAN